MAVTVDWYGQGILNVLRNNVDLESDTINASLHTTSYTPNLDTDDFFNDASNELGTANGYTAGGVALSGKALSYDAGSGQVRWDFTDPSWRFTSAVTWRYAVFRKARGGASSADELICVVNFGDNQTVSTDYVLQLDPAGLLFVDRN